MDSDASKNLVNVATAIDNVIKSANSLRPHVKEKGNIDVITGVLERHAKTIQGVIAPANSDYCHPPSTPSKSSTVITTNRMKTPEKFRRSATLTSVGSPRKRMRYDHEDDVLIAKYIINNHGQHELSACRPMWTAMAEDLRDQLHQPHPPSSLADRFKKYIWPKIAKILDKDEVATFPENPFPKNE